MDSSHIVEIERLREAAKEHGAVADLLEALSSDDDSDAEFWLGCAHVANLFAQHDRALNHGKN